jgi:hypothetical protein
MYLNRSIFTSIVAVGLVSMMPFSAATTEKPPNFGVSLNKITYQMSEQTVFQKLGQPQKTGKSTEPCSGATQTRLFYPGMTIDVMEFQEEFQEKQRLVSAITITGRRLGIDGGVKIGDPLSKAKKIYKKFIRQYESRNDTWNVAYSYSEIVLTFIVNRKNNITNISLHTTC